MIRVVCVVGFALALMSYWAPWVAHQAAGLAIAEVDFAEFPKFMPQVRAGELTVWRESFYMPLLVLSVALVVWAVIPRPPTPSSVTFRLASRNATGEGEFPLPRSGGGLGWGLARWLVRAIAIVLPITPSVFNVFESGEFQTQLAVVAVVVVLIVITPLLRRVPVRAMQVILTAWFLFGAIAPTTQFLLMKPALDAIYHQPVMIGWGVWAGLLGFGLLAISTADGGRQTAAEQHSSVVRRHYPKENK